MAIAFSRYFEELVAVTGEAERLAAGADVADAVLLRGRISDARERVQSGTPLRIAIIGEFSSGKSSLVGALTGVEVKIDADVCTANISEYPWHGLRLVDTPGIQAQEDDTDHDSIAREATMGADLVLFVMTNELFNPRLARHLRFVLDEDALDLAGKTAIVVNKIDRETNPEEMLCGEIQKVLGPHQDVPVYFCSASKYIAAATVPAAMQERFVIQSRIPALTEGIDHFVDDAGPLGRLTAPLQTVAGVLDALQGSLAPSEVDRNRLEIVRRQRTVLQQLQNRLKEIRKTWKQQAYSTVLNKTELVTKQIDEFTTDKSLDEMFQLGMKQAIGDLEGLHDDVDADVSTALGDAKAKLDEIGASPLAEAIRASTDRGATVSVAFGGHRPSGHNVAAKIGKASAQPLQKGMEFASQNAPKIRDVVYKIGKKMGKKFAPHEAKNVSKTIAGIAGKAGKVMPPLAVVLDLYLQFREENKKDEKAKYLAGMRISMRNAFADQAKLEAEHLEAGIVAISEGPVDEALAKLDAEQAFIAAEASQMEEIAREIALTTARCTRLRNAIMRGVEADLTTG